MAEHAQDPDFHPITVLKRQTSSSCIRNVTNSRGMRQTEALCIYVTAVQLCVRLGLLTVGVRLSLALLTYQSYLSLQ